MQAFFNCAPYRSHINYIEEHPKSTILAMMSSICIFSEVAFVITKNLQSENYEGSSAVSLALLAAFISAAISYRLLLAIFVFVAYVKSRLPCFSEAAESARPLLPQALSAPENTTCSNLSNKLHEHYQYVKTQRALMVMTQIVGGLVASYYGTVLSQLLFFSINEKDTPAERVCDLLAALIAFSIGYATTVTAVRSAGVVINQYIYPAYAAHAAPALAAPASDETKAMGAGEIAELLASLQAMAAENKAQLAQQSKLTQALQIHVATLTTQVQSNARLSGTLEDMREVMERLNTQMGQLSTSVSTAVGLVGAPTPQTRRGLSRSGAASSM